MNSLPHSNFPISTLPASLKLKESFPTPVASPPHSPLRSPLSLGSSLLVSPVASLNRPSRLHCLSRLTQLRRRRSTTLRQLDSVIYFVLKMNIDMVLEEPTNNALAEETAPEVGSGTISTQQCTMKGKRLNSLVWNDMTKIVENGQQLAVCNHCKNKFSANIKDGTSHMRRHIDSCAARKYVEVP